MTNRQQVKYCMIRFQRSPCGSQIKKKKHILKVTNVTRQGVKATPTKKKSNSYVTSSQSHRFKRGILYLILTVREHSYINI